jgi:trimethylamine corrinoid protein
MKSSGSIPYPQPTCKYININPIQTLKDISPKVEPPHPYPTFIGCSLLYTMITGDNQRFLWRISPRCDIYSGILPFTPSSTSARKAALPNPSAIMNSHIWQGAPPMAKTVARRTLQAYLKALFDTDKAAALRIVQEAVDNGMPPERVIFDVVVPGMEQMIGGMISDNLITLSQHFLASQIAEEVADRLIPLFSSTPDVQGTVVIGTSFGDFHGLGKKIVTGCLRARMFQVTDLGINVAPERFIEAAVSTGAEVIGISSMMVHTATGAKGPKQVRQLLKEQGLEQKIRLMVGGAPYRFHEYLYMEVGADAWGETAADAPSVVARLVKEVRP